MNLNFLTLGDFLFIRKSADDERTLTNSAEEVIRQLHREGWLHGFPGGGHRVIYEDSDGTWDEMEHDGERFIGFKPLGAKSIQEAYEEVSGRSWDAPRWRIPRVPR
jgi:hypothetical protein